MSSPDLTAYVDLALYDRDAQTIFDTALALAQVNLPGWTPREGHTEVVLLESLAFEVSEAVFAINRLPATLTELLLGLFGVERDDGAAATATVRFNVADTFGHTIAAGTSLRLELGDELVVDFETNVGVVIAPGSMTGVVAATALTNGAEAHAALTGTALKLLDAIAYVETVVLETQPTGGRPAEETSAYLDRGVQTFSRLVSTLVVPEHFTAAALEDPAVFRAFAVDNYNSDAGSGVPGDHPGHITLAVLGPGGATLSAGAKTTLDASLESRSMANLAVHLADPTVTDIDVTASVVSLPGYATADVEAAVVTALGNYLSPDTWAWGNTVRRNELISLLDGVTGVDYVASLTVPAADVTLAGYANLVDVGVLTITAT